MLVHLIHGRMLLAGTVVGGVVFVAVCTVAPETCDV